MKLESIKRGIKPYVPRRVFPAAKFVHRACRRALFWYVDLRDRRYSKRTGFARLPPASLRYRVHGSNLDRFSKAGKRCSEDIKAALEKNGKDFDSFRDVLDFGCGCGRTIIWFADLSKSFRLYGTDIDAEAISWCRDNLDFAEFSTNKPLPPLEYPSETFDLIYAISVFTHLDEDRQFRWLDDLKRITRSGGTLILTVHGSYAQRDLPQEVVADLKEKGFVFTASSDWKGIFPAWYQTTYHTKEYVLDRYSGYFNVLDYIPRGMNNHQDVVVLEKA